jgi:hypothetical protein
MNEQDIYEAVQGMAVDITTVSIFCAMNYRPPALDMRSPDSLRQRAGAWERVAVHEARE